MSILYLLTKFRSCFFIPLYDLQVAKMSLFLVKMLLILSDSCSLAQFLSNGVGKEVFLFYCPFLSLAVFVVVLFFFFPSLGKSVWRIFFPSKCQCCFTSVLSPGPKWWREECCCQAVIPHCKICIWYDTPFKKACFDNVKNECFSDSFGQSDKRWLNYFSSLDNCDDALWKQASFLA